MKLSDSQAGGTGGCAECQSGPLPPASPSDGGPGSGPPGPSVQVVDPSKPAFIVIQLEDTQKRPIGGAAYHLLLPNGEPFTGNLDAHGKVRIEGIDPGTCQVSFPKIDRREFTK